MNHQSLIATKANRIVRAAQGRTVLEFGSRRAQGGGWRHPGRPRGLYRRLRTARPAPSPTSSTAYSAGGTMAHSWVQMFDTQNTRPSRPIARSIPTNAVLLVDTYNTLKSGVPDAIRAFNEVLKPLGITKCGIRLDSGDMAYLTQEARKMLDEAGLDRVPDRRSPTPLDEYLIQDLLLQGAQIDMFGVGERLITARSEPVFGGVYKLAAVEDAGRARSSPRSRSAKTLARSPTRISRSSTGFYDKETGKAMADYICRARREDRRSRAAGDFRSRTRPGSARPSATLRPGSCRCRSSRTASWSTSARTLDDIRALLPCSRSIRSGMRSSALITRTSIMSTCPSGSGILKTSCCSAMQAADARAGQRHGLLRRDGRAGGGTDDRRRLSPGGDVRAPRWRPVSCWHSPRDGAGSGWGCVGFLPWPC